MTAMAGAESREKATVSMLPAKQKALGKSPEEKGNRRMSLN